MSGGSQTMLLGGATGPRLDGRVAWVTGASRGLGRSGAGAVGGAGATVVRSARTESALQSLKAEIEAGGGTAHVVVGSVADAGTLDAVVSTVEGIGGALDVLVNNAGISPAFKRSEHVGDDEWDRT